MGHDAQTSKDRLTQVRALLEQLEQGNDDEAERLLDELMRQRETSLFLELGKLTRELHEALNAFLADSPLVKLANTEIPDAKARLNHVVSMTESAANRTLNAVEHSLPLSESIREQVEALAADWQRFRRRAMGADEFRDLTRRLDEFLGRTGADMARLHGSLSEVLMAQDYQDLTGQIIRRVINLVQEVEDNLVGLIRISGQRLTAEPRAEAAVRATVGATVSGPAVPGVDHGELVQGQDEVDDLLSSLGF